MNIIYLLLLCLTSVSHFSSQKSPGAMPERHYKTRNQNFPESERRDRDREYSRDRDREYRRDRVTESYMEDRSTDYGYEVRTRNYREQEV